MTKKAVDQETIEREYRAAIEVLDEAGVDLQKLIYIVTDDSVPARKYRRENIDSYRSKREKLKQFINQSEQHGFEKLVDRELSEDFRLVSAGFKTIPGEDWESKVARLEKFFSAESRLREKLEIDFDKVEGNPVRKKVEGVGWNNFEFLLVEYLMRLINSGIPKVKSLNDIYRIVFAILKWHYRELYSNDDFDKGWQNIKKRYNRNSGKESFKTFANQKLSEIESLLPTPPNETKD